MKPIALLLTGGTIGSRVENGWAGVEVPPVPRRFWRITAAPIRIPRRYSRCPPRCRYSAKT